MTTRIALILAILMTAPAAWAQPLPFQTPGEPAPAADDAPEFFDSRDVVDISIVPAFESAAPGSIVPVAVIFDMDEGWHIWTNQIETPEGMTPFEFAVFTEIIVGAAKGLKTNADFIQWPEVHGARTQAAGEGLFAVFDGRAIAYVPVMIADDAKPGEIELPIQLVFQSCDDIQCMAPVDEPYGVTITVAEGEKKTVADLDGIADFGAGEFDSDIYQKIDTGEAEKTTSAGSGDLDLTTLGGLIAGLLLAFIGGFLLNLTPCVLPVIPIKIMGLAHSAGNRKKTLFLGIVMSSGVVAFWIGLGLAIVSISSFTSANQLFQYPIFSLSIGVLIAVLAVGMCGLFSIQLPQFVYKINPSHETVHGSFGFGVMTAVLSTPCTAPFMGAAAAAATTVESTAVVLTVFGTIGLGMASPYLVLAAFPKLVDRMPRTGPASELIKQVMGLFMLAASLYFIGVGVAGLMVSPPDPPTRQYFWVVFALVAAGGGWLAYKTLQITKSTGRRVIFCGLGVLLIAASVYGPIVLTSKGPIEWTYYTPERFDAALAEGDVIVLEFTAEWCLNCKYLESTVLYTDEVSQRLAQEDITPIKVDLTGTNEMGNAKLNEAGAITIPYLVVYTPDGKRVFNQAFYTVDHVLDAIKEAGGTEVAMGDG